MTSGVKIGASVSSSKISIHCFVSVCVVPSSVLDVL
jgi:hypothetical protein